MPTKPKSFDMLATKQRQLDDMRRYRQVHADMTALYASAPWRAVRLIVLGEQPICAGYPLPCMNPASEVDHITPLIERPDLAITRENLQGLCLSCHTRKTRAEQANKRKFIQGNGM